MKHPQADLIMQIAKIRADDMCEHWEYVYGTENKWRSVNMVYPYIDCGIHNLKLRMKPSHPDYDTEKNPYRQAKQKVDMSKLPVGTMTNCGEIFEQNKYRALIRTGIAVLTWINR